MLFRSTKSKIPNNWEEECKPSRHLFDLIGLLVGGKSFDICRCAVTVCSSTNNKTNLLNPNLYRSGGPSFTRFVCVPGHVDYVLLAKQTTRRAQASSLSLPPSANGRRG